MSSVSINLAVLLVVVVTVINPTHIFTITHIVINFVINFDGFLAKEEYSLPEKTCKITRE